MECNSLIDGFSLQQKLSARITWYGATITAFGAIFVDSPLMAASYLLFLAVTGYLAVRALCSRCPYPRQYANCLLMPDTWVVALIPEKKTAISGGEKISLYVYLSGMFAIPQYWLFQRPVLLLLFWALAIPALWLIAHKLCSRCRNRLCPLNRVPETSEIP